MVRPGARLRAPVLDDLQVVGLAGRSGLHEGVAGAREQLLDEVVADGMERTVLAGRRHHGPPLPGRSRLGQRHLGETLVELASLVARCRRHGRR